MSGEPLLAYSEVMAELRRLCSEQRSGTMFIVTASNQSASFALREGNIVCVRFQLKRGLDAVNEIKNVGAVRCKFTEEVAGAPDQRLPSTSDLLQLLSSDGGAAAAPPPRFSEAELARAETVLIRALAEFLGPMATVVVREHLLEARGSGQDLDKTVEAIAEVIPDRAKAARFKQEVLPQLEPPRR